MDKGHIDRRSMRSTVSVPSLDILVSSEKLFLSHGPNVVEIMHVSKINYFSLCVSKE